MSRWNTRSNACLPLVMACLMVACGGGGDGATATSTGSPGPTGPVSIAVAGGVGPSSAAAGSTVEIWATVPAKTEIVTRWSGATLTSDEEEWHVLNAKQN
jgi:hypothetical protein